MPFSDVQKRQFSKIVFKASISLIEAFSLLCDIFIQKQISGALQAILERRYFQDSLFYMIFVILSCFIKNIIVVFVFFITLYDFYLFFTKIKNTTDVSGKIAKRREHFTIKTVKYFFFLPPLRNQINSPTIYVDQYRIITLRICEKKELFNCRTFFKLIEFDKFKIRIM